MFVAHRNSSPLAAERLFGRSIHRCRRGGKRGGDRAVRAEPISDLSSIRLGAGRPRCDPRPLTVRCGIDERFSLDGYQFFTPDWEQRRVTLEERFNGFS